MSAGRLARTAIAAGLWLAASGASAEQIVRFDVDLFLEPSGAFEVSEEIAYDFGDAKRHGIFRDIPVRHDRSWQVDYDVALSEVEVGDPQGGERPHRVDERGQVVRIRIGDPDRFARPREDYRIQYRVANAIVFGEDYDELYWNATGNAWPVAIRRAVATLHLPPGLATASLQTRCFTGVHGSTQSRCSVQQQGDAIRFEATDLGPSQGLTVAVALPKGVIDEPTAFERALASFLAWGGPWLLAPFAAFALMFRQWRRHGRDRGVRDSIPVRYEPPEGLTPAEVGTLIDESADMEDVTATILDLAVRGYLEIEELETTKLLFLKDRDYRLHRKKRADAELKPHEAAVLHGVFLSSADSIALSTLKNRFYTEVPTIQTALYQSLADEGGYFPASPAAVRRRWQIGGALAVALAIGCWVLFALPPVAGVAALLAGAIVFVYAPHMPRRTRKGRRAYEEVLGFQEFMSRVDRDRLERMGGRNAGNFERCLPYAVVLGVADQWAEAFAGIYTEPPDWYHSPRYDGGFHPGRFVTDVGHSLHAMEQTFASQPSHSGSTGFSSGGAFGGGGFSGGGFGGGGGGSW